MFLAEYYSLKVGQILFTLSESIRGIVNVNFPGFYISALAIDMWYGVGGSVLKKFTS